MVLLACMQVCSKSLTLCFSGEHYARRRDMRHAALDMDSVFDSKLRVYGTSRVRAVDASAIPVELTDHITSPLYAVAEKAADIIRNDSYFL
jgi:hypothetical protein